MTAITLRKSVVVPSIVRQAHSIAKYLLQHLQGLSCDGVRGIRVKLQRIPHEEQLQVACNVLQIFSVSTKVVSAHVNGMPQAQHVVTGLHPIQQNWISPEAASNRTADGNGKERYSLQCDAINDAFHLADAIIETQEVFSIGRRRRNICERSQSSLGQSGEYHKLVDISKQILASDLRKISALLFALASIRTSDPQGDCGGSECTKTRDPCALISCCKRQPPMWRRPPRMAERLRGLTYRIKHHA